MSFTVHVHQRSGKKPSSTEKTGAAASATEKGRTNDVASTAEMNVRPGASNTTTTTISSSFSSAMNATASAPPQLVNREKLSRTNYTPVDSEGGSSSSNGSQLTASETATMHGLSSLVKHSITGHLNGATTTSSTTSTNPLWRSVVEATGDVRITTAPSGGETHGRQGQHTSVTPVPSMPQMDDVAEEQSSTTPPPMRAGGEDVDGSRPRQHSSNASFSLGFSPFGSTTTFLPNGETTTSGEADGVDAQDGNDSTIAVRGRRGPTSGTQCTPAETVDESALAAGPHSPPSSSLSFNSTTNRAVGQNEPCGDCTLNDSTAVLVDGDTIEHEECEGLEEEKAREAEETAGSAEALHDEEDEEEAVDYIAKLKAAFAAVEEETEARWWQLQPPTTATAGPHKLSSSPHATFATSPAENASQCTTSTGMEVGTCGTSVVTLPPRHTVFDLRQQQQQGREDEENASASPRVLGCSSSSSSGSTEDAKAARGLSRRRCQEHGTLRQRAPTEVEHSRRRRHSHDDDSTKADDGDSDAVGVDGKALCAGTTALSCAGEFAAITGSPIRGNANKKKQQKQKKSMKAMKAEAVDDAAVARDATVVPTATTTTTDLAALSAYGERKAVRAAQRSKEQAATAAAEAEAYWVLLPRVQGVNQALLHNGEPLRLEEMITTIATATCASLAAGGGSEADPGSKPVSMTKEPLLETAKRAFAAALHQPIDLELHGSSAGGTYMVRAHPAHCSRAFPSSSPNGNSGAGEILAVFKPRDEEIGQENNPHGNSGSDRTSAFAPGSGSRREVLAYSLDHEHFSGIPPTMEVATQFCLPPPRPSKASATTTAAAGRSGHRFTTRGDAAGSAVPHIGSLQLFIPGCAEAADVLPGKFSVEEVHALAIFDIRTLNGDRHGGNVLVTTTEEGRRLCAATVGGGAGVGSGAAGAAFSPVLRTTTSTATLSDLSDCAEKDISDSVEAESSKPAAAAPRSAPSMTREAPHLVPIDHSYICPSGYADPDYEWLAWPQSKLPFSARSLDYIRRLEAYADAELVRAALLAKSLPFPAALGSPQGTSPTYASAATAVSPTTMTNTLTMVSPLAQHASKGAWEGGGGAAAQQTTISQLTSGVFLSGSALGGGGGGWADGGGQITSGYASPSGSPTRADCRVLPMGADSGFEGASYDRDAADAAAELMLCTTRMLQIAALEFKCTARDIGNMCRRPRLACPSLLEELMEEARDEETWHIVLYRFEALLRKRLREDSTLRGSELDTELQSMTQSDFRWRT